MIAHARALDIRSWTTKGTRLDVGRRDICTSLFARDLVSNVGVKRVSVSGRGFSFVPGVLSVEVKICRTSHL